MKPYRPVHIMFLEFNFKSLMFFFFCYRTKIFQFMYYLNPTSPYSSDDYTRTEMISKLSALGCDQRIVQHQTPTQHVFGTAVNVHTTRNSMQKNVKFYHFKTVFSQEKYEVNPDSSCHFDFKQINSYHFFATVTFSITYYKRVIEMSQKNPSLHLVPLSWSNCVQCCSWTSRQ